MFARIWNEIWTRDNGLHLLQWLVIVALVEWPLCHVGGTFDWT